MSMFEEYLSRVRAEKNAAEASCKNSNINERRVPLKLANLICNENVIPSRVLSLSNIEYNPPARKESNSVCENLRTIVPRAPLGCLNSNVLSFDRPDKESTRKALCDNNFRGAIPKAVDTSPKKSPPIKTILLSTNNEINPPATKILKSVLTSIHESAFETDESDKNHDEDDVDDHELHISNQDSTQLKEWFMKDVLPERWEYAGVYVEPSEKLSNNYDASVCINLNSVSETENWVKQLSIKSGMDFRIRKTFPNMSSKVASFKIEYRCHNNTMASMPSCKTKNPHYKHVECPFLLRITIRNTNMSRSSEKHLKTHPCKAIFMHVLHNHPVHASDVLRHRRPHEDVVEKFTNFFRQNHSPSSALNTHKFDLQGEYGSEYIKISADGSLCPSLKWCYYWYKKMFNQLYGPQDGLQMVESLKKFVSDYNQECGSECSSFDLTEDGQYMVVICSPIMKKVHEYIRGSGEIAFVDSGSCMDRHESKVFLIMTPSVAGALPLGIIITSSECEILLLKAFRLWMSILPKNAFYGKETGPSIFMTDDCTAERNTLKDLFPHSTLFLCIFHVLQFVWRWLLESKHQVDKTDKPILYSMFKDILNAKTKSELDENYSTLKSYIAMQKYKKAEKYFAKLKDRVSEWALCCRQEYLTRGHNTNNYCEATMRILKDHIFFRTKAFSLVQLFHFLTTRVDKYFERRIVAVLNNRVDNYVKSRYHIKKSKLIPLTCSKESEHVYSVTNSESKMTYSVNMDVEMCTCPVGKLGAPCKHQYAVVLKFNLSSNQFLPFSDEKAKKNLYKVISDSSVELPKEWFTTLRSGPINPLINPAATPSHDVEGASSESCDIVAANADIAVDRPIKRPESISETEANEEQAERMAKCLEDVDNFTADLKRNLTSNPDDFLPAVEKMMKRYKNEIKTHSSFVSALQSFNRFNNATAIHPTATIPIQTTAPGRRKKPLSGRNHPYITGRPPNSLRLVSEHGYGAAPKEAPYVAKRQSAKAPHCISQRVNAYAYKQ